MTARIEGRATPDIIAKAAEWAAELDVDDAPAAVREAAEAWCRENPLHRRTLDRMRGLDARFDALEPAERGALRRQHRLERERRGRGIALGAAAIVALGGGWLASQSLAVQGRFPDYATAVGVQRTVPLADGSELVLDTGSSADVTLAAGKRTATLFQGRLFVKVAPDPAAPFVVRTRHGQATALGTTFTVGDEGDATVVTVVESKVRACARPPLSPPACVDLAPGDRARLTRKGVTRLAAVTPSEASGWTSGWLEIDDRPVAEVLDALSRYRATPVRYDAGALRGLRVTGSYPLAAPDRSLEAIAATAGLTIARRGDEVSVHPSR